MSTRNPPDGKRWGAYKADNLTAICEQIVWKMWEPRHLTTIWANMACYRITLPFFTRPWRHMVEWRYSSTILDLGTKWGYVVSFSPRPLYRGGKALWYVLSRRLGEPQSQSGRCGQKKNFPVGNRTVAVQPAARRYADWAILVLEVTRFPNELHNSVGEASICGIRVISKILIRKYEYVFAPCLKDYIMFIRDVSCSVCYILILVSDRISKIFKSF
jgi:hypothetical protein